MSLVLQCADWDALTVWQITWFNAHIIYGSASSAVENPCSTLFPSIKPVDRPQDGLNASLSPGLLKNPDHKSYLFFKSCSEDFNGYGMGCKNMICGSMVGLWGRIILKIVKNMEFALFKPSIVGYLLAFHLSVQTHYPPNSVFNCSPVQDLELKLGCDIGSRSDSP